MTDEFEAYSMVSRRTVVSARSSALAASTASTVRGTGVRVWRRGLLGFACADVGGERSERQLRFLAAGYTVTMRRLHAVSSPSAPLRIGRAWPPCGLLCRSGVVALLWFLVAACNGIPTGPVGSAFNIEVNLVSDSTRDDPFLAAGVSRDLSLVFSATDAEILGIEPRIALAEPRDGVTGMYLHEIIRSGPTDDQLGIDFCLADDVLLVENDTGTEYLAIPADTCVDQRTYKLLASFRVEFVDS